MESEDGKSKGGGGVENEKVTRELFNSTTIRNRYRCCIVLKYQLITG